MFPYDAVLFDLDGTLTESAPGIMRSAGYAARKMGYEDFDPEVLRRFIGPPLFESFQQIFGMDDAQAAKAVEYYREDFDAIGWSVNAVYTGIPALLRSLKREGIQICLATAKPILFAERILRHFGLWRFFDRAVGITMSDHHADKAAIVHDALPEGCERPVMVGDRHYDVTGGRQNGIDTIGVLYGYGSREELVAAGATHIAESVDALQRILLPGVRTEPGFFLSIEGLDGSGKSSQIERLCEHLRARGYDVVRSREPGGCPIAEEIRRLVLDPAHGEMCAQAEALLYAAGRAQHVRQIVRPALEAGKVLVCDRFVDSSAVYQGAARGLGLDAVMEMNAPAIDGTMPDATLYFAVEPRTAMARRSGERALDRIEQEKLDFHERVYEAYEELARRAPGRIVRIDASQSIDEIARDAAAAVDAVMDRR